MHFNKFSFGALRIDGSTYEQDVVIDCGEIRKRKQRQTVARSTEDDSGEGGSCSYWRIHVGRVRRIA